MEKAENVCTINLTTGPSTVRQEVNRGEERRLDRSVGLNFRGRVQGDSTEHRRLAAVVRHKPLDQDRRAGSATPRPEHRDGRGEEVSRSHTQAACGYAAATSTRSTANGVFLPFLHLRSSQCPGRAWVPSAWQRVLHPRDGFGAGRLSPRISARERGCIPGTNLPPGRRG